MTAAAGHYDHWHDDNFNNRLVGMSLNLSPLPFREEYSRLRERESERMLAEIANTGLGSALIFRIADHLQHRISDMEGDEPKTAFAGWFRPDLPDFFEELRSTRPQPDVVGTLRMPIAPPLTSKPLASMSCESFSRSDSSLAVETSNSSSSAW